MVNQQIIDITYVVVQSSMLFLQIQDKQGMDNLYQNIISLVVMTIFLVISVQQQFKLESKYFKITLRFIKLTLYSFEPANNDQKITIEQIIKIKYVLLGVYFSNIVNVNYNLITWRKIIKISIYVYYSLVIIIISQDFDEDSSIKIILLVILSLPFEISLLYQIYKNQKKTQQFGQVIISPQLNQNLGWKRNQQSQLQRHCLLFSHLFSDGMVLLGDKEEIIHMNRGMNKILQQKNKKFMLNQVLDLQNCTQEFKDEDQFRNLFNGLESKFQHHKNREQDKNFQSPHVCISESLIVRNEYEKAINIAKIEIDLIVNQINSQDQSLSNISKNNQLQEHKALYESKLICRLQFENLLSIIDEQQEFLQFSKYSKEQQNREKQNKLIEVTINSYIQENLEPYVCIIVRDVTLFNELNVEKQMNQNKSKMLSQVAHEFRNPLNCIVLLSETAAEKFQRNQNLVQQYLQPIVTSANQLLSLVNDLLDLSQLKAGKFSIVNQEFDIAQLITNIYKMLLPQAKIRNLYLQINIPKNIPKILTSDPNRIRQIIMNLIKEEQQQVQQMKGFIKQINLSQNYYKVSVEDTGIGIDIQEQSRLFQAFGKIEGTKHLNQQGVGLGLMISHIMAQRLSQSHQDEQTQGLIAHSEGKNTGSLFYFIVFDHSNNPSKSVKEGSSLNRQISFDLLNFQFSSNKISSQSSANSQGSILAPNSDAQLKKKEQKLLTNAVQMIPQQQIVKHQFSKLKAQVKIRKFSLEEIRNPQNIKIVGQSEQDNFPNDLDQFQYSQNIKIEGEPDKDFSPKDLDSIRCSKNMILVGEPYENFSSKDFDLIRYSSNIRIVGEPEQDFSPKDLGSIQYSSIRRIVGEPEQDFSPKYLDPIRSSQNIRIVGEPEEDFSPKDLGSIQYSSIRRRIGVSDQDFYPKLDLSKNLKNNKYWFKQCQCKEILLIDDQPFNIQALTLSLQKYNLKISSVTSNYQTVGLLNELKVQICCQWIRIILMDIEMPISDGFQTTIDIRNMEKVIKMNNSNFVPSYIIGCSGHGQETKKKCLDIGMNDYLTKPVKKLDLINIIQNLVQLERLIEN